MFTTRPAVLIELLSRRIVGAWPTSGCLSRVTVTVAVHALPAFATDGLPASATLRSLASAAGAAAHAATTATAMSFFMVPPRSTSQLHRRSSAGSAGRRVGAAREDGHAPAAQRDRDGRGVVGVRALAQRTVRVRTVDENVAARRQVRDVDGLTFPLRHVVVAEAGRDALAERACARTVAAAVAGPARVQVRGTRLVGVVQ